MKTAVKLVICVLGYSIASRLWSSFVAGYITGTLLLAALFLVDAFFAGVSSARERQASK